MDPSNKLHPQKFRIKYSCFTKTLFNEINFQEGKINFKSFMDQEDVVPTDEEWAKFWDEMDEIDIWDWDSDYSNDMLLDGCDWSLWIRYNGKRVKSRGTNNWPDEFDRFKRALKDLVGFDISKKEERI